jgi:flagellar biosynthetic protein FlhB
MAGDADKEDKTEAASAKRLQQARDEGKAPLSPEVAGLAVLVCGVAILSQILPGAGRSAANNLALFLAEAHRLDVSTALSNAVRSWVGISWWFAIGSMLAGSLGVLGQTGFLIRLSAASPNFSKLNPLSGLARVFGPHNFMQAAKSALKIAVMGAVGWNALAATVPEFRQALFWSPTVLAERMVHHITSIAVAILGIQGVIAGADLLRTRLRFNTDMRMTKQEQRDESRESEGDPHIKARLRQIRQQRSRRRMMQAVPQAAVVVTNPTHYAVALAYDRGSGGAPRIVAKGMDEMAARIRKAAQDAGVPLVANPPLARALYPLPLDREIPAEHFKAVAELIAYVWKLNGQRVASAGRRE